jgi:excisionase family DNA binding protein
MTDGYHIWRLVAADMFGSAPEKAKRDAVLLTLDEAAQHLNVTADQVTAFVQDGELRYINVGRGKKRPRVRFTIEDLDEFIETRRRRDVACQSTKNPTHRSTTSTSKSEVIGFTALRAARLAKTPSGSKL